jgi:hypothetical protein
LANWIAQPNFTNVTVDKNAICYTANRAVTGLCANSTYTSTETPAGGNGETGAPMRYTLLGEPLPAPGPSPTRSANWLGAQVTTPAAISNGANIRFLFTGEGKVASTYTYKLKIIDGANALNTHEKTWVVTTNSGGATCATPP